MKRIGSWVLTIVLVLGMCACGQNGAAAWQEQYDLGVRYLSEGNYTEAVIAFTAAIEIDSKRPEGYIGRGDAYVLSGETEENLSAALADYEAAITLDETLPNAWLGLADVYIRQGNYDKALTILKEALDKTNSNQEIVDKIAQIQSGEIYDSFGHIRRRNTYDENGQLIWYHTFESSDFSKKILVKSFDATGKQTGEVEETKDDEGHLLTSYRFSYIDGVLEKIEHVYDEYGNETQITVYQLNGMVVASFFEYDDLGNKTKVTKYTDGQLSGYEQRLYDENGQLTEQRYFGSDGEKGNSIFYQYDEKGNEISSQNYGGDGSLFWEEYREYDGNGLLINSKNITYWDDGTVETKTYQYIYDESGNQIGYKLYDGGGNLLESTVRQYSDLF